MARSNQGQTPHGFRDVDVAHLHPLTNVPTKYQLPTPHGFRDVARTRFYRSKSLWQGQTMTLHITNIPTKYQLPTPHGFQEPGQDFIGQSHYSKLHTSLPNQCPYQVSTSYTLQFLRYSPDKHFAANCPPAMDENNTLYTSLEGSLKFNGVKPPWQNPLHTQLITGVCFVTFISKVLSKLSLL